MGSFARDAACERLWYVGRHHFSSITHAQSALRGVLSFGGALPSGQRLLVSHWPSACANPEKSGPPGSINRKQQYVLGNIRTLQKPWHAVAFQALIRKAPAQVVADQDGSVLLRMEEALVQAIGSMEQLGVAPFGPGPCIAQMFKSMLGVTNAGSI